MCSSSSVIMHSLITFVVNFIRVGRLYLGMALVVNIQTACSKSLNAEALETYSSVLDNTLEVYQIHNPLL